MLSEAGVSSRLNHDSRFTLPEGDISTRLVLEFDLNLATFASGLVIIVIIIVGGGRGALSLDTTSLGSAIFFLSSLLYGCLHDWAREVMTSGAAKAFEFGCWAVELH